MAVRQIPNLPPAVFLSPTAQLEIVQDGVTYRASALQIADLNANLNIRIVNNITDTNICFPLYSTITDDDTNTIYTSDPTYNYIPSEARLTARRMEASQSLFMNSNALTLDYSIPIGDNAMSSGPVAVSAVLTIPTGSVWAVI
jgi:hypothetical protein